MSAWAIILGLLFGLASTAGAEPPEEGLWFPKEESVRLLGVATDREVLERLVKLQEEKIKALEQAAELQDALVVAKDALIQALRERDEARAALEAKSASELEVLRDQVKAERGTATTGKITWFGIGGGSGLLIGVLLVLLLL